MFTVFDKGSVSGNLASNAVVKGFKFLDACEEQLKLKCVDVVSEGVVINMTSMK